MAVHGAEFEDAHLVEVGHLPCLERITFSRTQVTERGLQHLRSRRREYIVVVGDIPTG